MLRIGYGEDTHRLVENRKLVLAGIEIPFELGLLGHSDADVLTHAIIDALLGACALGDIGSLFPDTSDEFSGISSIILLERTMKLIRNKGFEPINVDATLIAQKPRLAGYRDEMRKCIAAAASMPIDRISIKFTTPEHLGPEGRLESMSAGAVALGCSE